jgi:hypothetical protein
MEDKLVKNHHSHFNFYFKRVGAYFSIFIGASVLVAIPVSVAVAIRNHNEIKEAQKEEETKTEETKLGYLIY